mmetsp:Transcript_9073/g.15039  ORF Transcript_9073/g.15039 Transcript_9073/m.15039 type:complete len:110 (-) Transcript_9073:272-601(-)|eukprot:CAMPEP_0174957754 /NCGR_PEP_ID=MMETSP0004_2-20121128/2247_1 /TAXON_ID=420556 /ORGANISM="Ochromonas sp., Strain CCMP1393" /LENGTH=109 /DNA_ID=CAMNT_0016205897 /DNA_START=63 /DNA_END=392 /DNA_ORIENTATION=+
MTALLQKRRKELKTDLLQIEKQIFDLETTYLEETKEFGNIFTGWDEYLSADKVKQRKNVLLEDRQFSLSSVTSPASRRENSKKTKEAGVESSKKRKLGKAQSTDKGDTS